MACPSNECINGQVYNECGSACPATCDNQDPICIQVCVSGCECPSTQVSVLFYFESQCVLSTELLLVFFNGTLSLSTVAM